MPYIPGVHQIVFNEISAAEVSRIPTLEQLDLLSEFQVTDDVLNDGVDERYGRIEREGEILYRFRTADYRIYFQVEKGRVIVHRVLHKNSLSDFLFRANLASEDQELSQSKHFWELIDEGEAARRQA